VSYFRFKLKQTKLSTE